MMIGTQMPKPMIQTVGKVLRSITHAQVANCVNHSVKVLLNHNYFGGAPIG